MNGADDRRYSPSLHAELQERLGEVRETDVFLCSTHNWFNWIPGFQFVGLRLLARRGSVVSLFDVNGNFASLRKERWSGDLSEVEPSGSGRTLKVRFPNGESVSLLGGTAAEQLRSILLTT
jgi:hypothetical protein